jgi:hypothetical protein
MSASSPAACPKSSFQGFEPVGIDDRDRERRAIAAGKLALEPTLLDVLLAGQVSETCERGFACAGAPALLFR